jgi:hypothetical protein
LPFVPGVIAGMRTAPRRIAPPRADVIARASKVASTIAIISMRIARA